MNLRVSKDHNGYFIEKRFLWWWLLAVASPGYYEGSPDSPYYFVSEDAAKRYIKDHDL